MHETGAWRDRPGELYCAGMVDLKDIQKGLQMNKLDTLHKYFGYSAFREG